MAKVIVPVRIPERLWEEFARIARRRRRKPESLVEKMAFECVQRIADEELLAASESAARRAGLHRRNDIEEIIRQYRRQKARKANDGRTKTPNARSS